MTDEQQQTRHIETRVRGIVKALDGHGYIRTLTTDWVQGRITVEIDLNSPVALYEPTDWSHGEQ